MSELDIIDWHWIDGQRVVPSAGSAVGQVVYPATGQRVADVSLADLDAVDAAVRAARRAFDHGPWPRTSPKERALVMREAHKFLQRDIDELTRALTFETGTPVAMAAAHMSLMVLSHTTDLLESHQFEVRTKGMLGTTAVVKDLPVGVVAAIAPWNAPLYLALAKVAPALAAGCTVVLKPDASTPLDAFMLADALHAAGLPPGVLNVVPATSEVSESLVRHPQVDRVAFTGGVAAGRRIGSICGAQFKRLSLELGGKSAAVVLDDADIAQHVTMAVAGGLLCSGQACAALTRILLPAARYREFLDAIVATVEAMRVGDPFDPATTIGPIINSVHVARIDEWVQRGIAEGATLLTGGRRGDQDAGFWYLPTVLGDVSNDMHVARAEIFGPVVSVIPYDDEEMAIRIANNSEYGLGGAVFGTDVDRAINVAHRIRTGTVGVNTLGIDPAFPFGGFKQSGVGREFGREGLASYLETQTIGLPLQ